MLINFAFAFSFKLLSSAAKPISLNFNGIISDNVFNISTFDSNSSVKSVN
nr:hypothetical protein [Streptobacillus moniliformis]